MASEAHHVHFVMIPLMAPGHIIPMIDMAKLLSQNNVTITIVTTQLNAIRFSATITRAAELGLPIRLRHIRFPSVEAGLPEGCENADEIPSADMTRNFFVALEMLQQPLEQLFYELEPSPNCIISDKYLACTAHTARKFRIPRIIFDGTSCFTQLCMHSLATSKVHESVSQSEPFVVPGLPHRIELTKSQLPGAFNPDMKGMQLTDFRERIRVAEIESYGLIVNSFEELEQRYVDEFQKVQGRKVWCVGPLSLCNKDGLDKVQRGNKASIDELQCLTWLNSWQAGSVVYACLGSLTRITPHLLMELALGLEASNHPFILVIRAGDKSKDVEKWILEEGFEERTKGRGLLIRGWAPQVLILSHPAIGGFLTHCGWNSTLECVSAGVPMITWPLFAEQFINEKLIVQVLEIGVSVGAQVVVNWEVDEDKMKVSKEDIKGAVCKVMEEGKEGVERRERARKLGEMANRSVERGGSSQLNMTLFIQDIIQQTKGL